MLIAAAALLVLVGLYHSLAGERRLIRPLLAMEALPRLGHGPGYTRALIRTAWHLTTLTWFGIAGILVHLEVTAPGTGNDVILWLICAVFAASGAAALVLSRARHPAWMAFLPVAALTGAAALWA